MNEPWLQDFNPLGNAWLSTLAAAVPVCTLFFFLAVQSRWLGAISTLDSKQELEAQA